MGENVRRRRSASSHELPQSGRADTEVAGHWLLARLGKRVLRPGGLRMTRSLLAHAGVALGEATLTMQGGAAKAAIVAHTARVLRPGGGYSVHELALTPDSVDEGVKTEIRHALSRSRLG